MTGQWWQTESAVENGLAETLTYPISNWVPDIKGMVPQVGTAEDIKRLKAGVMSVPYLGRADSDRDLFQTGVYHVSHAVDPDTHRRTIVVDRVVGPNSRLDTPRETLEWAAKSAAAGVFAAEKKAETAKKQAEKRLADVISGKKAERDAGKSSGELQTERYWAWVRQMDAEDRRARHCDILTNGTDMMAGVYAGVPFPSIAESYGTADDGSAIQRSDLALSLKRLAAVLPRKLQVGRQKDVVHTAESKLVGLAEAAYLQGSTSHIWFHAQDLESNWSSIEELVERLSERLPPQLMPNDIVGPVVDGVLMHPHLIWHLDNPVWNEVFDPTTGEGDISCRPGPVALLHAVQRGITARLQDLVADASYQHAGKVKSPFDTHVSTFEIHNRFVSLQEWKTALRGQLNADGTETLPYGPDGELLSESLEPVISMWMPKARLDARALMMGTAAGASGSARWRLMTDVLKNYHRQLEASRDPEFLYNIEHWTNEQYGVWLHRRIRPLIVDAVGEDDELDVDLEKRCMKSRQIWLGVRAKRGSYFRDINRGRDAAEINAAGLERGAPGYVTACRQIAARSTTRNRGQVESNTLHLARAIAGLPEDAAPPRFVDAVASIMSPATVYRHLDAAREIAARLRDEAQHIWDAIIERASQKLRRIRLSGLSTELSHSVRMLKSRTHAISVSGQTTTSDAVCGQANRTTSPSIGGPAGKKSIISPLNRPPRASLRDRLCVRWSTSFIPATTVPSEIRP